MSLDALHESILKHKAEIEESDWDFLQPIRQGQDAGHDYWAANNTYNWYRAIGRAVKPRRIVEIGVRFGYSLYSLVMGSLEGGQKGLEAIAIDSEGYEPGSQAVAARAVSPLVTAYGRHVLDTNNVASLSLDSVDLAHVDGDHSEVGCRYDMWLVWETLKPGGVLLVDDVTHIPDVGRAVRKFQHAGGSGGFILPTFRGLFVAIKPRGDS